VLAFFLFPFVMMAVMTLTQNMAFQATGIIGLVLFGLMISAFAIIVPAGLIYLFFTMIRGYYRKPSAGAAPAAATVQPAAAIPGMAPGPPPIAVQAIDVSLLEELRGRLAKESRRRVATYVPIALLVAFGLFYSSVMSGGKQSGSPLMAFVVIHGIFGLGAWIYAVSGPNARYATAFKDELLPRLLKDYGDLRHSKGTVPQLVRLSEVGMLPEYDNVAADDAITGTYRGYPISMTELLLTKHVNRNTIDMFRGLLIDISVDTRMLGITVLSDKDSHAERREHALGLQNVRLEDPVFNEVYRISGNDQVEARAVLTPAVMQKLLDMADGKLFFPPRFVLEGHRMSLALYQQPGVTGLFEPPPMETYTAEQQLAALRAELATIFGLVDAMIDMRIAWRPHAGTGDDHLG
jgi:hypothetical protein